MDTDPGKDQEKRGLETKLLQNNSNFKLNITRRKEAIVPKMNLVLPLSIQCPKSLETLMLVNTK